MSEISYDIINNVPFINSDALWIDFDGFKDEKKSKISSVDTLLFEYEKGLVHLIEFKNTPLSSTSSKKILDKFIESKILLNELPCWALTKSDFKLVYVYSKLKSVEVNISPSRKLNLRIVKKKLKKSDIDYIDDEVFTERYRDHL